MGLKSFINPLYKLFIPKKEYSGGTYPPGYLFGYSFDGEQEPGALNDVYLYDVDYYELAKRAYTLVTINEYAEILAGRLTQFVVGTGLRLHPQPMRRLLKRLFKIELPKDFAKDLKELWSLIEDDPNISSTKELTLHGLAQIIFYNGFIAGDVLVIKRVKNKSLEYQVINGLSVMTGRSQNDVNGNRIVDGVEIDENEVPVAYYIAEKDGKETRVPARDSKGRLIAWLVPVGKKRLGQPRAYTQLGAIMQKLHKIGQYSNSEVMAAETNAKFAAWIEQDKDSTGVNPIKSIPGLGRTIHDVMSGTTEPSTPSNTETEKFKKALKRIASGLFIHMPKGQKLNSFDTKRPNVNHTAFVDGSMKYAYASGGVPFEVALMVFSNNFSASRASLKMFEFILEVIRKYTIEDHFYQIVYKQSFELECLKGNIKAEKYLALKNDDGYLDNAYTKARFIGNKIPHIDEVKEVNAVLSKIKGGLSTFEQGLETLGIATDFDSLIERRKYEEAKIKEAGLTFETLFAPDNGASNDEDTEADLKK